MDQRVDVELHLLAVVVHVFEQGVELVDGVDRVRLARGLAAPAAPDRGLQRHVGVGVARHQVELQLGRHDGLPALGVEQLAHVAQHRARRKGHAHTVAVVAVVDDLRRGVGGPGHDAHGGRVRAQVHVAVRGRDDVVVGPLFRELARHAHGHDGFGQAHAAVFVELLTRQDLAARHAREVGHQALDLGDAVAVQPLLQVAEGELVSGGHGHVSLRWVLFSGSLRGGSNGLLRAEQEPEARGRTRGRGGCGPRRQRPEKSASTRGCRRPAIQGAIARTG